MKGKKAVSHSKIVDLLKVLSGNEINELGRYLGSTAFKCDPHVRSLFKFLKKFHPNFDSPKFHQEALVRAVYPTQKTVRPEKLHNKISDLTRLVRRYLILKEADRPGRDRLMILANILKDRKSYDLMFRTLASAKRKCQNEGVINHEDYLISSKAGFETYFHPNYPKLNNPQALDLLSETSQQNLHYFVLGTLRLAAEARIWKLAMGVDIIVPLTDQVMTSAENLAESNPLVKIYYLINQLWDFPVMEYLIEAEDLFAKHISGINKDEHGIIITHLINFSVYMYMKGEKEFQDRAYQLYRFAFEKDLLESEGFISDNHFLRALSIGIDLNRIDWCMACIQKYGMKIRPERRTGAQLLGTAMVTFKMKKFEEVIGLLAKTDFQDLTYALTGKSLMLKSYYELSRLGSENYPVVEYCESYRQFLRRNKQIKKPNVKRNMYFIAIVKRLANHNPGKKDSLKRELLYKLEGENVISKDWLLEKIAEL